MRIYDNGIYRNATNQEIAEMERQQAIYEQHKYDGIRYSDIVVAFIREKYTLDDELAIQRQKEKKADEWEEYFAYCEECKNKAKKMLEVENE